MDATGYLLRRVRNQRISICSIRMVEKSNDYKNTYQKQQPTIEDILTLCRIYAVLADHKWHKTSESLQAAGLTLGQAKKPFDLLPLAESDTGRYLCLPSNETPLMAPDEKEGKK